MVVLWVVLILGRFKLIFLDSCVIFLCFKFYSCKVDIILFYGVSVIVIEGRSERKSCDRGGWGNKRNRSILRVW